MTRLIGEIANIESGAIFRLTSLKPLRPENAPDPWEAKSLLEFESGVPEAITMEPSQDGTLLRYMAPLVVLKSCLPCHAVQGYKLGDVRGGISVSQRYSTIQASSSSSTRQSSLIHASIFVLIALLGWVLLELLRKRWFELAGKVRELEDTRGVLLQSEKMASLGRMVAGFAHEINTPVGVAVGAVSQHEETLARIEHMLTQDEVNEDALRAELNSLRQGGALALSNLQRAAKLVHSFKRTSIDQSSDEVRVFAIHELIQDVLYTLQNVLKRLPIKINVMCDTKLRLHSMPGLIEQLLTNLIMNAVQHAFEGGKIGGTIEINVSQKDDSVVLIFKDDGAGMSAQQLARAFEPFFHHATG
jgi:signal transduction histidine kinase